MSIVWVEYIEKITFTNNMIIGDGFTPFSLSKEYIIPETYSLSKAYPNPFNPTATLSFSLPVTSNVTLDMYDINSRIVNELINGSMDSGYHSVVWNTDSYK